MKRLLLVLASILASGFAKSYFYPEIKTDVYLQPDGTARIVQERTYSFNGSFSWAFVDLARKGSSGIELVGLEELTDGGWVPVTGLEVEDRARSVYVRWGYHAQDEERTFRLEYVVSGVVQRYEDVAVFYWKVIEDEHEPVASAEIRVFPPGASPSLFKVYVHSRARPGTLEFSEAMDEADVVQHSIPGNAFVEVRVLAEPGLFDRAQQLPGKRYQRILDEEKRNFVLNNVMVFVVLPLGVLLMLALPVVMVLYFYRRYGREPEVHYEAIYEHEPPRPAPPVAVPGITYQKIDKGTMYQPVMQGMFATLLDLANKGAVSVEETKEGRKSKYRFVLKDREKLERQDEFSRKVARFFFSDVAGGDELTEEKLKKYAEGHSTELKTLLGGLADEGRAWWETELKGPLLDEQASRAYTRFSLLTTGVLVLGGFLVYLALRRVAGNAGPLPIILPAGVGVVELIVFLGVGRSILRWQPYGLLEHLRWQRFKKFLEDFSAIEQAPVQLLAIWEHYYVYATVLGVAKEFLKNVTRLAEQRGLAVPVPAWYIGAGGFQAASVGSMGDALAGFQSFASNMSSMMSSFSTSTSSGGGFSGGGGGGGGGGSSGAG